MPRKLSRYLRGLTTEVGIRTSRNFVIATDERIANTAEVKLQVDSGAVFTGNAGIGSTNPQEKLDVVGNVKLSGNLQIGTGASFTAPTDDSLEVKVGVGTTALNISPGGVVFNTAGRSWWSDKQATGAPGTTGFTAYTDPDLQTTQLDQQYSYLFRLVTTGTGTNTGAVYLVWYSNDTTSWQSHLSTAQGTSSNHPQLRINGSTVEIYTEHASSYNILYNAERYFVDETDSTAHIFGSDYTWTRIGSNVGFHTTSPEKNFTVRASGTDQGILINAHDKTSKIHFYPQGNSHDIDYPRLAYYDDDWNPSGSRNVPMWHIDGYGRSWQNSNLYIGRTRTYAATPTNYYKYQGTSGPGIHIYNGISGNEGTNYSAYLTMRCFQDDTDDRNIIYYVNAGTTNAVDYDQHQYFGVKANGKVHAKNAYYSGRVESDEATPNSVYIGSTSNGFFTYYNGSYVTYMRARNTDNTDICYYLDTGGGPVFKIVSNGNGYFDGGADIGPADYAEYFEWADGNPNNEDRRGYPVIVVPNTNGKIGIATTGDDRSQIMGIVSANPGVVGDTASLNWQGRHLKDEWGSWVTEDQEFLVWNKKGTYINENGEKVENPQPNVNDPNCDSEYSVLVSEIATTPDIPQYALDNNLRVTRPSRVTNPDYDPSQEYVPRSDRQEWDPVGLMGKLWLRPNQPTGDRWIKLRDGNNGLSYWLVR